MRFATKLLIPLVAALVLPIGAAESHPRGANASAYDDVSAVLDEQGVPGWAVAVITTDDVVYERIAGTADGDNPITAETPFLIGSVSKSMTAAVVMQLVERGEIDLDEPAVAYLPDFELAAGAGRDITVRQLLTHTSGISATAGLTTGDVVDDDPDALQQLVRSLADTEPVGKPGEEHVYSSANYLVLGALVERVTGQPFASTLTDELLEPLGMGDTITTSDQATRADLSAGHRYLFGRATAYDRPFSSSGVPYGYVGSTLSDMTAYARMQLGAETTVMTPESIDLMHQAQVTTSGPGRSYGLGWSVGDVDGIDETVVEHTGETPGFFAHLLVLPERGIAVVMLANAASEARAPVLAGVGHNLLRVAVGAEAQVEEPDPILTAAPWVALGLALLGLATLALQAMRLVRARRGRTVTRVVVSLTFAALVVLMLQVPALVGAGWRELLIWAPDTAWALLLAIAVWGLAAVVSLARGVRAPRTGRLAS